MAPSMTSLEATIETLEHQWMRAWIQRDRKAMKALIARDFIFVLGSEQTVLLDRASWLEAAGERLVCSSYRFGQVYVRRHGNCAIFATSATLEARIGPVDLSGAVWIVDIWKKARMRRRWKLVERSFARPDGDDRLPGAVKTLQLWK